MKKLNLKGKKLGHWTIIAYAHYNIGTYWWCECDCGEYGIVRGSSMKLGTSVSCGCVNREITRINNRIHGHNTTQGQTPTYRAWGNMKSRCLNPNYTGWKNYGGRGIEICDRWVNSFENFLEDMGEKPEGLVIDRIDNEKGYYKENCRWTTYLVNNNNRRERE